MLVLPDFSMQPKPFQQVSKPARPGFLETNVGTRRASYFSVFIEANVLNLLLLRLMMPPNLIALKDTQLWRKRRRQ